MMVRETLIRRALATINDPELGIDLVSLGLVYAIVIDGGDVRIRVTLTTPGCPLIDTIMDDIRFAVGKVPGVTHVVVDLTFDPPWNPAMMSVEAKEMLGIVGQPASVSVRDVKQASS